MDYKTLEKEELKEVIKTSAEAKGFDLPASWYSRGIDKLLTLADEIDRYQPKREDGAVILGNSTMKKQILTEKKVSVFIPEDMIDHTGYISIWVNGVQFIYAREQEYQMPACVAEVYRTAMIANNKARKKMSKFAEIK